MSEIMDWLAEENPNIGEHLRDWQHEAKQNGDDPLNWQAFREHELAIGAPDVGEEAPEEFSQFDWTTYGPSAEPEPEAPAPAAEPAASAAPAPAPASEPPAAKASVSSGASAGSSVGVTEPPHKAKKSLLDFLFRR